MDRVDVTSSTLYHHQPKSLFTIYITSAIILVRSPNLLIIMSFFYSIIKLKLYKKGSNPTLMCLPVVQL